MSPWLYKFLKIVFFCILRRIQPLHFLFNRFLKLVIGCARKVYKYSKSAISFIYIYMDTRLGGHSANHLSPMVCAWAHMGQNVRDSGRTFEFLAERSRVRLNVQNCGRTFAFLVERSNFRLNFRISGRTFGKIKNKKLSLGPKSGLPEFLVEAKLIFGIWILIFWGQTYKILSKSDQKWPKRYFIFSEKLIKIR